MKRKLAFLTLILVTSFFLLSVGRAWTSNGTAICTAIGNQDDSTICSDGAGGAIIAWSDGRLPDREIYVQRVNSEGTDLWTANGKYVTSGLLNQDKPVILSDGNNGAFVAWRDFRNGDADVYVQHIDSTGNSLWTLYGVPVCIAANEQQNIQICSDMAGGVIITWEDRRTGPGTHTEIYAQRVNSTGITVWTNNGIGICTKEGYQREPYLCSDGAGGAIITWRDGRSEIIGDNDIYVQRINSSGDIQWDANGTIIANFNTDLQTNPAILCDGTGGAIIVWVDERGPANYDIYGQKINSDGITQWTSNGTVICNASDSQDCPVMCSDGAGGAIITWVDSRPGSYDDIYAQRINSAGTPQWTTNGIPICNEVTESQVYVKMVADGNGGAYIAWTDYRNDTDGDIYAQNINSNGITQWTLNGTIISEDPEEQSYPELVLAKNDGVIIVWDDYRASGQGDIYAFGIIPSTGGGIPGFELTLLLAGLFTIVLIRCRKKTL